KQWNYEVDPVGVRIRSGPPTTSRSATYGLQHRVDHGRLKRPRGRIDRGCRKLVAEPGALALGELCGTERDRLPRRLRREPSAQHLERLVVADRREPAQRLLLA